MTSFAKVAYSIPALKDLAPLIKTAEQVVRSFATSKDITATALQTIAPVAKLTGDKGVVSFGESARKAIIAGIHDFENIEFEAYHFHPSAPYNVYTYKTFKALLKAALLRREASVTAQTKVMIWIVSADNQEAVVTQVNALRTLLGQPVFKKPPVTQVRNRLQSGIAKVKKVTATKLLPDIKTATSLVNQTSGIIRDASGFASMIDGMIGTLKKKAKQLEDLADKLRKALEKIEATEAIEFDRIVLSGAPSNEAFFTLLHNAENQPKDTDLVAASVFIYDSSVATFIEGLL